jgi:DNA-binding sugar fermentation-stimulating protein
MTTLLQLTGLMEAVIVARPSKQIKSPYVADVCIVGGETALAHTPALGCCGLSDKSASVLVAKASNKDAKCEYVVYLAIVDNVVVGIHPKLAETVVENALKQNCLNTLLNVKSYVRETTVIFGNHKSRFDFAGVDADGVAFILEVKSVPLCITNTDSTKTAYFPEGYRKKKNEVVSPRALKHITELHEIRKSSNTRCIMCYVIQRGDVFSFQTSYTDPEYRLAVSQAHRDGVEIITLCIDWSKSGTATFVACDLPYNV